MLLRTEIPFNDLSWEELLHRLDLFIASDFRHLEQNIRYFKTYQAEMTEARKRRNLDRIQTEINRINLVNELLTRLTVFEMLALQKSIDQAVKIALATGGTLPEKYQYIITVDEDLSKISTQYKPLC